MSGDACGNLPTKLDVKRPLARRNHRARRVPSPSPSRIGCQPRLRGVRRSRSGRPSGRPSGGRENDAVGVRGRGAGGGGAAPRPTAPAALGRDGAAGGGVALVPQALRYAQARRLLWSRRRPRCASGWTPPWSTCLRSALGLPRLVCSALWVMLGPTVAPQIQTQRRRPPRPQSRRR